MCAHNLAEVSFICRMEPKKYTEKEKGHENLKNSKLAVLRSNGKCLDRPWIPNFEDLYTVHEKGQDQRSVQKLQWEETGGHGQLQ